MLVKVPGLVDAESQRGVLAKYDEAEGVVEVEEQAGEEDVVANLFCAGGR